MIRAAIISIVFLGITLTMILMQPSKNNGPDARVIEDDATVTRAQTEFETLDMAVQEPTYQTTATVESYAPQPSSGVLAPVFVKRTIEPEPATTEAAVAPPLEQLIVNALTQGQSEAYIDALVNDAAEKGQVEVPQSLVTEDGRVDTGSLLAVLSTPASNSTDTGLTNGSLQNYVVQAGDSLASISYRFYGNTRRSVDIFAANNDVLRSASDLRVGQTLVIPAL